MRRNEPCSCGSRKKYKKCCGKAKDTGLPKQPPKITRAEREEVNHILMQEILPAPIKEWMTVQDTRREQEAQLMAKSRQDLIDSYNGTTPEGHQLLVNSTDPNLLEKLKSFMIHDTEKEK